MQHGAILIFIAAFLWGLDGILRRSLYSLPPITIVLLEHVIGLIILAPFLFRVWKRETLSKKEWGALGVVALFSGVLGTLFFTTALLKVHFISFSVVLLLQKLQPLFAVFVGWVVLGEKVSRTYIGWALLALAAGYFVTFPFGIVNLTDDGAHVMAALFAVLAAACWGGSTALSRLTLLNHSPLFITGVRFLITVPIALVFLFVLGAAPSLNTVTDMQYATLALIALSTGMVALFIYYKGLRTTPVAVAAIMELAYPVVAVGADYFLYGTVLVWSQYLAALVLLYAMYKVSTLKQ